MNIDLTPIVQAIIALLAALVTHKLIPWINSKTTEKQRENLEAAARTAVFAAEQIYGAGGGEKKLEYAIDKLRESGFDLDKDALRAAIEAAVYGMNCVRTYELDTAEIKTGIVLDDEGADKLPPLEEWPLSMIVSFCEMNDIPHENCSTKEDFICAIMKGCRVEPPDEDERSK